MLVKDRKDLVGPLRSLAACCVASEAAGVIRKADLPYLVDRVLELVESKLRSVLEDLDLEPKLLVSALGTESLVLDALGHFDLRF